MTCDNPAVLATAFRQGSDFTLHLANPKWSRQVTIEGLPGGLKELGAVRTAYNELFKTLEPVKVEAGRANVVLPPESLTTLTTIKPL